jgi:hypothetical protein
MRFLLLVLSFGVLLGTVSCAKPPAEEMNQAEDAVTRAENDPDAAAYAGNTLARARTALTRMRAEADSKRYEAAKTYAAEAISNAQKALADGKAGAARAKEDADKLLETLPLADTEKNLDTARQARDIELDFKALEEDLEEASRLANEAQANLEENKYQDALEKGQNARSSLSGINSRISEAAQALSRKK